MEIYEEKQDQKLVPVYKLIFLNFSSITKNLRSSLQRSYKHFRGFPRSVEDAFLTAIKQGKYFLRVVMKNFEFKINACMHNTITQAIALI